MPARTEPIGAVDKSMLPTSAWILPDLRAKQAPTFRFRPSIACNLAAAREERPLDRWNCDFRGAIRRRTAENRRRVAATIHSLLVNQANPRESAVEARDWRSRRAEKVVVPLCIALATFISFLPALQAGFVA
jgi:hypothetical protein